MAESSESELSLLMQLALLKSLGGREREREGERREAAPEWLLTNDNRLMRNPWRRSASPAQSSAASSANGCNGLNFDGAKFSVNNSVSDPPRDAREPAVKAWGSQQFSAASETRSSVEQAAHHEAEPWLLDLPPLATTSATMDSSSEEASMHPRPNFQEASPLSFPSCSPPPTLDSPSTLATWQNAILDLSFPLPSPSLSPAPMDCPLDDMEMAMWLADCIDMEPAGSSPSETLMTSDTLLTSETPASAASASQTMQTHKTLLTSLTPETLRAAGPSIHGVRAAGAVADAFMAAAVQEAAGGGRRREGGGGRGDELLMGRSFNSNLNFCPRFDSELSFSPQGNANPYPNSAMLRRTGSEGEEMLGTVGGGSYSYPQYGRKRKEVEGGRPPQRTVSDPLGGAAAFYGRNSKMLKISNPYSEGIGAVVGSPPLTGPSEVGLTDAMFGGKQEGVREREMQREVEREREMEREAAREVERKVALAAAALRQPSLEQQLSELQREWRGRRTVRCLDLASLNVELWHPRADACTLGFYRR